MLNHMHIVFDFGSLMFILIFGTFLNKAGGMNEHNI
jgi:hypothetical protein